MECSKQQMLREERSSKKNRKEGRNRQKRAVQRFSPGRNDGMEGMDCDEGEERGK
jgi:hypothetical protein